ncbi:MAG: hypothetical protein ACK56I_01155, partial [bacterium]
MQQHDVLLVGHDLIVPPVGIVVGHQAKQHLRCGKPRCARGIGGQPHRHQIARRRTVVHGPAARGHRRQA